MNIIIIILTILIGYGIILYAYKAFKKLDKEEEIENKMEEIRELETTNAYIKEFKKAHKGNRKQQRKDIKNFKKE